MSSHKPCTPCEPASPSRHTPKQHLVTKPKSAKKPKPIAQKDNNSKRVRSQSPKLGANQSSDAKTIRPFKRAKVDAKKISLDDAQSQTTDVTLTETKSINYPRRNLSQIKHKKPSRTLEHGVPIPIPISSTPVRGSGSHPVSSTPQTKKHIDAAIMQELDGKRTEAGDLVDHLVGAFLLPEHVACVLQTFLDDKFASILQGPRGHKTVVDQAIRFSKARGCVRGPEPTLAAKAWLKSGSMKLPLPVSPVDEGELIDFLNGIITRAFKAMKSANVSNSGRKQVSQFTAIRRQGHALPLSHPDDESDMRPDFGLLPLASWQLVEHMPPPAMLPMNIAGSSKQQNPGVHPRKKQKADIDNSPKKSERSSTSGDLPAFDPFFSARTDRFPRSFASEPYLNFTTFRCVGECKTSDSAAGKRQLKRYVRGIKRAQPWLRFALGFSYAKGTLHVARADQSGTEETSLDLSHPGHVLDFVRLMVGLAMMTDEELGADPAFELGEREALFPINNVGSLKSRSRSRSSSRPASRQSDAPLPTASLTRPSKRKAREDADETTSGTSLSTAYKLRYIKAMTGQPLAGAPALRYTIEGILHVSGSLRGRGTVALAGRDSSGTLVAVKRMWGDCARPFQEYELHAKVEAGIKLLSHKESTGAAFVIRAIRSWTSTIHGRDDSTLRSIRGYFDNELNHPGVEERIQYCLVTNLKRPISLFRSLQDVVGGIVDAMKGHQFLVERLGILHRDISETNIVLRVDCSEKPRGYLMDLDMATKQSTVRDEIVETSQAESSTAVATSYSHSRSGEDGQPHGPPKAARTGTPPYMAAGVLRGHEHTVSHDLESFFYVLYLFLHTYDGPLSLTSAWPPPELFIGERTRRLPHVRNWPSNLQSWTSGNMDAIASDKIGRMSDEKFVWSSLRTELPKHWQQREDVRELVKAAYEVFWMFSGVDGSNARVLRTDVKHDEFIDALERWLKRFPRDTAGS